MSGRHANHAHNVRRLQKTQPQGTTPLPIMAEPFTRVAIDMVGPLTRTKAGNKYILTLMDYGRRYPEATEEYRLTNNGYCPGGYILSTENSRRNPLRPGGEFHFQIDARPLQALGSQVNKNITLSPPDKWSR